MVKLSSKYLIRRNKANKYFLNRKKDDSDKDFLLRVTHLFLQNQFIEQILKIKDLDNVKFLYLQQNLLKSIENMENFPNLTHLYLQRNFLVKIENLNVLKKLKKIYLGQNQIQILEGMEYLREIKEIHFECQDLPLGETIYFEPLTIQNLGSTLEVLNISENCLTSLYGLKGLLSLRILKANNNYISDVEDITTTIGGWQFLQELSLVGNFVTKNKWYRDSIIYASKSLELLDQVPIHPNTRTFIENLINQKKRLYMKHINKSKEEATEKRKVLKFVDDVKANESCCFEPIQQFPLPGPIYTYPFWQLRTNVNSVKSANPKILLPRQFWKKGNFNRKSQREEKTETNLNDLNC